MPPLGPLVRLQTSGDRLYRLRRLTRGAGKGKVTVQVRERNMEKKTASAFLLPYVYYCNPCEYLGVQRKYMKYFYIKVNMDFED